MERYTIRDFERDFPNDEACLEWLRAYLYPDGIYCASVSCGRITKHHRVKSRPSYSCDRCGRHEHPMAGTIFEGSRTSLRLWFRAIFLMASTRSGVSAKHLERDLGVTYKTAWRMFRGIRSLLAEDRTGLSGAVEIDETLVGGKRRYRGGEQPPRNPDGSLKRGRRAKADENKTAVLAMIERGGRAKTVVIPEARAATILPHIRAHVLPDTMIYTDEAMIYDSLPRRGYQHRRVHHAAKVYVSGDAYTNTAEGFFSLMKRGISGVYHAVSADRKSVV